MAAPLRSTNPGPPPSTQFTHFGLLDAGAQSKASTITSLVVNVLAAFVIIVIGMAHRQDMIDTSRRLTAIIIPIEQKKPEPVKPKIVPPKPKLPDVAKVEQPKISIPRIKPPELLKQPIVKMDAPKPLLAPPAPRQVIAMAAPKVVNLGQRAMAASVPNNDPHPSAVRLGNSTSPLNNLHGPAVAPVNLAAGMPGMNTANTGNGPRAAKVNFGNGSPESTSIKGNGVVAVAGIPHGIPGGTGTARTAGSEQVNLGHVEPPPMPKPPAPSTVGQGKVPRLIYKPKPSYTEDAKLAHVEGVITVHIHVLPNGSVEVVGLNNSLGHGLDESARRAAAAMRFEPATDASGHPIEWDGFATVEFQLADREILSQE